VKLKTESFVFLAETARLYAAPWVRKNRIKQELEQSQTISVQPGLTSLVTWALRNAKKK
jgi:hypothetical protein